MARDSTTEERSTHERTRVSHLLYLGRTDQICKDVLHVAVGQQPMYIIDPYFNASGLHVNIELGYLGTGGLRCFSGIEYLGEEDILDRKSWFSESDYAFST